MRKILVVIIIIGFLIVDWPFFHAFLKEGKDYMPGMDRSLVDYLIFLLSIPFLVILIKSLFNK